MPNLTDLDAVVKAIGSFPSEDLQNAAEDAIANASDELGSALWTTFGQQARQDDFSVDYRRMLAYQTHVQLKLTQGFVNDTPAITVKAARSALDLGGSDAIDITDQCDIDKEKGIITFSREVSVSDNIDLRGSTWQAVGATGTVYFRAAYTAGFEVSGDTYTIPADWDWVKRLATLKVRIALDQHPVFRQNESTTDVKLLQTQYANTLQQKIRYAPRAHKPVASRKV